MKIASISDFKMMPPTGGHRDHALQLRRPFTAGALRDWHDNSTRCHPS